MASISDYAKNPDQALIDAAADPFMRQFMDDSDIEVVSVDVDLCNCPVPV